jgi:tetratricopeptide (TPR) repeat protein
LPIVFSCKLKPCSFYGKSVIFGLKEKIRFLLRPFSSVLLLFAGFLSLACIWDQDTLLMEKRQFPGTMELISGFFLTHSPEFYYWRIQDREKQLAQNPDSLPLYDDLAVAYDKLGDHSRAVSLAQLAALKEPRRYETLANLGTFYMHDGQLRKGLDYLKEAFRVSPDAHFGRERYQQLLVEYLISVGCEDSMYLPLNAFQEIVGNKRRVPHPDQINFYQFLLRRHQDTLGEMVSRLPEEQLQAAITGLGGMIRFGQFESPVLLDALGELLAMAGETNSPARHLAACAFLRASQLVDNLDIQRSYEIKAAIVLEGIGPERKVGISELKRMLSLEVKRGEELRRQIRADENCWIARGIHPEKAFAQKYYFDSAIRRIDLERSLKAVAQDYPSSLDVYLRRILARYQYKAPQNDQGGLYEVVEQLVNKQTEEGMVYRDLREGGDLETPCQWSLEVQRALGGEPVVHEPGPKRPFMWLMIIAVLGGLIYFVYDWMKHPPGNA